MPCILRKTIFTNDIYSNEMETKSIMAKHKSLLLLRILEKCDVERLVAMTWNGNIFIFVSLIAVNMFKKLIV